MARDALAMLASTPPLLVGIPRFLWRRRIHLVSIKVVVSELETSVVTRGVLEKSPTLAGEFNSVLVS